MLRTCVLYHWVDPPTPQCYRIRTCLEKTPTPPLHHHVAALLDVAGAATFAAVAVAVAAAAAAAVAAVAAAAAAAAVAAVAAVGGGWEGTRNVFWRRWWWRKI